jgi:TrpR-related protein YerC/YecD
MKKDMFNKDTDFLFDSILQLKTRDECYAFFQDLLTVPEIESFSQRLAVARMLKNKIVYTDIVDKTGASSATISRVNRFLINGNNGYEMILDRMEKNNENGDKHE